MTLTEERMKAVHQKANDLFEQYEGDIYEAAYKKTMTALEEIKRGVNQSFPKKTTSVVEEYKKEALEIGIKMMANFMLEEGMDVKEKMSVMELVVKKIEEIPDSFFWEAI